MKLSPDEQIERRVRILMICVSVALLAIAVASIFEFRNSVREERDAVGLVLPVGREDSAWSRSHYDGLSAACEQMGYDLLVQEHISVSGGDCRKAVEFLAGKGVKKIFLPSGGYLQQVKDLVHQYPRIQFYANAVGTQVPHVTSYSLRYYELHYLSGILAGLRTKSNHVGYIAPVDCPEMDRSINAFALGVQRANPEARVRVYWIGRWFDPEGERDAVYRVRRDRADVIAYHLDDAMVPDTAEHLGIDYIACYEANPAHEHCLGAITVDWEKAYMDLLQNYFKKEDFGAGLYWPPMIHGLMAFALREDRATEEERRQVEKAVAEIWDGHVVFSGEIYDNQGIQRSRTGECISVQYLQNGMNWLVRGVESVDSK